MKKTILKIFSVVLLLFCIALTGVEQGKDVLLEERRWEFAFEGQRYWDLLRRDGIKNGLQVAKNAIDYPGADDETLLIDDKEYKVNFRTVTEGLFQIPQTQLELSDRTLNQNPGWSN